MIGKGAMVRHGKGRLRFDEVCISFISRVQAFRSAKAPSYKPGTLSVEMHPSTASASYDAREIHDEQRKSSVTLIAAYLTLLTSYFSSQGSQ